MTVDDGTSQVSSEQSREVATTAAINIPGSVSFGTLTPGTATTNSTNYDGFVLTQNGNDQVNAQFSMTGTGLTCATRGEISRGNIEYSLTDTSHGDGANVALTGTAATLDVDLGYRTSESVAITDTVFWNVNPDLGTEGACSGTATVNVIAE